jgi:glyoxylase-like metal-dependent hydrolase (beta-lactamase superfamily II)
VTETFEAATGIRGIDTNMFGRRRLTSAYLLEAQEPALVETGPTTSVDAVLDGLSALSIGAQDLAHVVVTHIHLDHAGGAGALVRRFPSANVWVHERGAPHLAEPDRLVASASRIYGEQRLVDLFGPVYPIPSDRFDLELAVASIERIRAALPSVILFSHFGPAPEVTELCGRAIDRLRRWAAVVDQALRQTDDLKEVVRRLRTATEAIDVAAEDRKDSVRYDFLSSYEMNAMGLIRYLTRETRPERGVSS